MKRQRLSKFMRLAKIVFILSVITIFALQAPAQTRLKSVALPAMVNPLKATQAYAEVLLRKTDLEADLEDLLVGYTEDYPKVKAARYELGLINASMEKILAVNISESAKLTSALGKLLVRKAALETDLWSLKSRLGDEHPDVKRAARKVAVFDKAVKEILP